MYFDKFRQIVFGFYVRLLRQLCLNAHAEASFHWLQVHPPGPMLVACSHIDSFTLSADAPRLGQFLFLAHTSTSLRSLQMHHAWVDACFLLTHSLSFAGCRCIPPGSILVSCSHINFFSLAAGASRLLRCLLLAPALTSFHWLQAHHA